MSMAAGGAAFDSRGLMGSTEHAAAAVDAFGPGLEDRRSALFDDRRVLVAAVSAVALAIVVVLTATRAATLTELDSWNLANGLRNFDPAAFAPHPPGYPLVILSADALSWLGTPAPAFLGFAFVGTLAALGTTFLLGRELFGARGGLIAGALLCTVPLFWYYGDVVSVYPGEEALAPLVALFAYRVGSRRDEWSAYALLPS